MSEEQAEYGTEQGDSEVQQRISVPGDTCLTALNRLVSAGELDEAGKAAVLWFYGHCRDKGMSLADAGTCIDRDATTVHRLFNGRYGAGYANLVAAIVRYRKLAEQRAKRRDIGYIETSVWRKVSAVCKSALFDSMPTYIYGASQIGKTAALLEYARRNNHGQTKYVRMPAAPTLRMTLEYLAAGCYVSTRQHDRDLRRRIMAALDDKTLLIVDEVHQVMVGCSERTAGKIMEFLREVYDRTGCGLVMAGTKVFRDELAQGPQALVYEQSRRRALIHLQLPDVPPRADVLKIAAAFGLDEPADAHLELIREMLAESGLGKFIKYLQFAHGLAVGKEQKLTWEHFAQAYRSVQALSRG